MSATLHYLCFCFNVGYITSFMFLFQPVRSTATVLWAVRRRTLTWPPLKTVLSLKRAVTPRVTVSTMTGDHTSDVAGICLKASVMSTGRFTKEDKSKAKKNYLFLKKENQNPPGILFDLLLTHLGVRCSAKSSMFFYL